MLDTSNDVALRIGDEVMVDSLNGRKGIIESIRVISNASVVEEYNGSPNNIVLTVHIDDSIVNIRGIDISLPAALV